MGDGASVIEQDTVRLAGVDVQSARLVVVRQIAAEASVGLRKHLRGLKPFRFADQDLLYVRGNDRGLPVAIDVIVAASLKCFHQRALASISKRDNGQISVLWVRVNDSRNLQSTQLPQVCGAQNGGWRVVFECG